jgi:hypothetical protein
MSDPYAAPAGWYPQPDGTGGQRWWDGARWTEHTTPLVAPEPVAAQVAAPQYGAVQPSAMQYPAQPATTLYAPYDGSVTPRVPSGTPVDTPWIWVIVALPLLSIVPFFLFDFEGYMSSAMTDPSTQLRMYLDPMYVLSSLIGWLAYGVAVVFAYLDVRALKRLGYARQFHWAWAFLSSFVYVIGRAVVVKRQAGRGWAPMWVGIALNVVVFIGVMTWMITLVAQAMETAIMTYPSA